jgi:hypothetical protein
MKHVLIFFAGMAIAIAIGLLEDCHSSNPKDSRLSELDSIYAEQDTLAYIQKMMLVAYPQLSKWEVRYYAPIFRDFCKTYKVPAPLMVSIIGIESQWNPTLTSRAGCKGLGQLLPSTAEIECRKLGIDYTPNVTEWTDVVNLVVSLNYFCSKYEKNGREYAIKSYVGGPAYKKTTGKNAEYISYYNNLVEKEAKKVKNILHESNKLMYVYRGVIYEHEHESITDEQKKIICRLRDSNPTVSLIR